MVEGQTGISARELLQGAYERLSQKHEHRKIVFSGRVAAEIADDSDYRAFCRVSHKFRQNLGLENSQNSKNSQYHRIRKGYMHYADARVFQFDKKVWALARGENGMSYPAEIYDSDILALELNDLERTGDINENDLVGKIEESSYFRNSLVYATTNEQLSGGKIERLGKQIVGLLRARIDEFIAQEPEYDTRVIDTTILIDNCVNLYTESQ